MIDVRISGKVRATGSVLVRYGGPTDSPLIGLMVIAVGALEFEVAMDADALERLARNAARMADRLRDDERARRRKLVADLASRDAS